MKSKVGNYRNHLYRPLTLSICLIICLIFSANDSRAQASTESSSSDGIAKMVSDRRFVVQVESVSPLRGGLRRLTPGYTFKVTPDTVMTDLPYFGRAYSAPMNPGETGIKFTSLNFEYTPKDRKKGGWDIKIKPKDVTKFPQLNLTVMANGNTSIRIVPTDRESISYSGTIRVEE
ncbi:MAG TPA: DUF4251 domain-containing protein [Chryseolinea sp.]|nr:DUF4251 domain-containing protein [Chryseolinea sp.]